MGTWGTALFSDDTAADVRDEYKKLLQDGHKASEATDIMLEGWKETVRDSDEGPVFWLALAGTQWKLGRLEDRVKQKAVEVVDRGLGLDRWRDDPRSLKKRQAVLSELREQLLSPRPAAKKIRAPFKDVCEWNPGELIGYCLPSGRFVILQVVGQDTHENGVSPIFVLLDWVGQNLPDEAEIDGLQIRSGKLSSQMLFNRLVATYPDFEMSPYDAGWKLMMELGIVKESEAGSTDPKLSLVRTERMDRLLHTKEGRQQLEALAQQRGEHLLELPVQFSIRRILKKSDMPKARVTRLSIQRAPLQTVGRWVPMYWHDVDDELRKIFDLD